MYQAHETARIVKGIDTRGEQLKTGQSYQRTLNKIH